MDYLIIENTIIKNIIDCENDDIAKKYGAVPSYENASIGTPYNPTASAKDKEKKISKANWILPIILNLILSNGLTENITPSPQKNKHSLRQKSWQQRWHRRFLSRTH